MSSVREYKRVCEVITGHGGKGLKAKDLRIKFKITKTVYRTPNTAEVKIFNLNPSNEALIKGEFDDVLVNVGYEGAARMVFRGNVRHAFTPREKNDRIMQIDAADGDRDFKEGIVNFALAGGTSGMDLIDHIIGTSFTQVKKGYIVLKNDKKRLRGRVVTGMARDVLDDLAAENDAHWSIQNGELHIVPVVSTLPNVAIVMRSDTGLLSAPEISDKGIKVRCLLNPDVVPNGKIWLDNEGLRERIRKEHEHKPGAKPHMKGPKKGLVKLDPDGIYKVFKVEHEGDDRGPDWFSDCYCVALEAAIPSGRVAA